MPAVKELKKNGRATLKRHYFLLVILCAISAFFGTEFTLVKEKAEFMYAAVTGKTEEVGGNTLKAASSSTNSLYEDLVSDNIKAGKEKVAGRIEEYKNAVTGSVLARKRGILAGVINTVTSGGLYVTIFEALHNIVHSPTAAAIIPILVGLTGSLLFWIFVRNVFQVLLRRASLEARLYEQVPIGHMLYLKLVGRWAKAAWTLLIRSVYEYLWSLTIVGGFIKHYSYFLVPYIVAENPDLGPKKTILLSRQMMYGHKWECFLLDLSMIGWHLLGLLTFGILDIFWTNPYLLTAYNEFYASIRYPAKELMIDNAEKLNDEYLFRTASQPNLDRSYRDVLEEEAYVEELQPTLTKTQRFFTENFGLWIGNEKDRVTYNDIESRKARIREEELTLRGKAYPMRLSPFWTGKSSLLNRRMHYMNNYTIWSVIMIFFFFAFIGWAYEVGIHLVKDGMFVNRGAMHGPWLPIYGGGVALIVLVLKRLRKNVLTEILGIIILCGFVEYFTSFFMELATGLRWWDYTGYFLNLNGRICAEGLLVFALGGTLAVYLIVPSFDAMLTRLNIKVLIPLSLGLLILFVSDMVYSHYVPNTGEGITDYTAYQEES